MKTKYIKPQEEIKRKFDGYHFADKMYIFSDSYRIIILTDEKTTPDYEMMTHSDPDNGEIVAARFRDENA